MDLFPYFRSVLQQDFASVVICDLDHTIIYMNPMACKRYAKHGGEALVGKSLLECHNPQSGTMINKVVSWFKADKEHNIIHTFFNEKENKDVYMVALRDENEKLIGYYEKHEYRAKDETPLYDFGE